MIELGLIAQLRKILLENLLKLQIEVELIDQVLELIFIEING